MHELYIVYISLEYDWYWTEMHRTHTPKKHVHQPIHHGMDLDCWVKSTICGSVFYHVLCIQNGRPIWYPPWLPRFNFYMSTWHGILIPAVARTREISSCEIHWNSIPTVSYLGVIEPSPWSIWKHLEYVSTTHGWYSKNGVRGISSPSHP